MNINLTLLGEMITFIIFVWFTMRYIWPPVLKAMQDRQKKIADGLEAAEHGEHSLELAKKKSVEILSDSHKEASTIVNNATSRAQQIVVEGKAQGETEGKRMVEHADRDIMQRTEKARCELQDEVIDMVVSGASKVLEKEIDKKSHEKMLDKLITELKD